MQDKKHVLDLFYLASYFRNWRTIEINWELVAIICYHLTIWNMHELYMQDENKTETKNREWIAVRVYKWYHVTEISLFTFSN